MIRRMEYEAFVSIKIVSKTVIATRAGRLAWLGPPPLIENSYWRWIGMNGERHPGESLPFEPSITHADGQLIAIVYVRDL